MSITAKDYYGRGDERDTDDAIEHGPSVSTIIWASCAADCCGMTAKKTRKELIADGWQMGAFARFCINHSAPTIARRSA